jgi:hypothetical protein
MVHRCIQCNGEMGNDAFKDGREECFNPKGIVSFSPRLARLGEGLPWVNIGMYINPEMVEYQRLISADATLSGL